MFVLGNIQSMGVEIQSKKIRTLILSVAQELRTTFGKMPNKVAVTSGQVVTIFRASCNRFIAASKCRFAVKIYPTSVLYPQFCIFIRDEHKLIPVSVLYIFFTAFQNNLFSINFSFEQTGSIQIHSTLWLFKMSSAIDNTCSGNKKLVFTRKVWQNLRE